MKTEGGAIRITFKHAQGLNAKGGALKCFAIAGADNKLIWADAIIDGESVVVSSPNVPQPVAVRYAWLDNSEGCNIELTEQMIRTKFNLLILIKKESDYGICNSRSCFGRHQRSHEG